MKDLWRFFTLKISKSVIGEKQVTPQGIRVEVGFDGKIRAPILQINEGL